MSVEQAIRALTWIIELAASGWDLCDGSDMHENVVKPVNRREALRSTARWLALLGLGAGAVMLGRGSLRAGCAGLSPCGGCGELARCGLPRAVAARRQTLGSARIQP
ncbi:MAG: hypothetical protein IPM17_14095 [Verrucomicrobia bacterium]|jgi:hypothetical protein|nr:hypothetical protein [Verrucomicrobiota bacterium]